jgi:hypothetical protein
MFRTFHNLNMDELTTFDTLDPAYFKAAIELKAEFKEASKDSDNNDINPFHNLAIPTSPSGV